MKSAQVSMTRSRPADSRTPPTAGQIAALDRLVRETAIETSGRDDAAALYGVCLNLLWWAQSGMSPGYSRLDPEAASVPRQRPEPL